MAWYYGSDSGTAGFPACTGAAPFFYIGKIGGGTTPGADGAFNTTTASTAGTSQTFAYWDLEGPTANPGGMTMTQWGTAQAQAFVEAWLNGAYGSLRWRHDILPRHRMDQQWVGYTSVSQWDIRRSPTNSQRSLGLLSEPKGRDRRGRFSRGLYQSEVYMDAHVRGLHIPVSLCFMVCRNEYNASRLLPGSDRFFDPAVISRGMEDNDLAV